jgi:CTP-dependent riboflavin kinase
MELLDWLYINGKTTKKIEEFVIFKLYEQMVNERNLAIINPTKNHKQDVADILDDDNLWNEIMNR